MRHPPPSIVKYSLWFFLFWGMGMLMYHSRSTIAQARIDSFLGTPRLAVFVWWPNDPQVLENKNFWPAQLKQKLAAFGYDLRTQKEADLAPADIVFVAYPHAKPISVKPGKKLYFIIVESPLSAHQPLPDHQAQFVQKIFTWRRDLVDNQKIIYMPVHPFMPSPVKLNRDLSKKDLFVTQIASNLYYGYKVEKYADRRQAVAWWLSNHPNEFTFYGKDWRLMKNNLPDSVRASFDDRYKGYVADKQAVIRRSKFVLAYENAYHNDYVSEKIYDVMKGGAVPIYRGAPNITDFVPQACFINRADFKDEEHLYTYLKNMSDEAYQTYLDCIQNLIDDPQKQRLSFINPADVIIQHVLDQNF